MDAACAEARFLKIVCLYLVSCGIKKPESLVRFIGKC